MGHNPKIPLGFRPDNLRDAYRMGEPVNIYCLNCTKVRSYSAWRLQQEKGCLPFGVLVGGFWCRQCKTSTVVILFPCDITTPFEWVRRYRTPRMHVPNIDSDADGLYLRLDTWGASGNVERLLGRFSDFDLAKQIFPFAVARYPDAAELTLRSSAQVFSRHRKPES
jgi:hypothetical protein